MDEETNRIGIGATVKRVKALIRDISEDLETIIQGAEIVLEMPLISEKDLRRFERANIYEHLVMISMCQPELIPEPETAPEGEQLPVPESVYEAGVTSGEFAAEPDSEVDTAMPQPDTHAADIAQGRRGHAAKKKSVAGFSVGQAVKLTPSGKEGVISGFVNGLVQVRNPELGDLGMFGPEYVLSLEEAPQQPAAGQGE